MTVETQEAQAAPWTPEPGTWWVVIERDEAPVLAIGPYADEPAAVHAMTHALLIDAECQENCLECYVQQSYGLCWDGTEEFAIIDPDDPNHTGSDVPAEGA